MGGFSPFSAEANLNKPSWAYLAAVCCRDAMGARLPCDRATIRGAVEHMKECQRSAVLSDRSLPAVEREAQLRRLDIDAHAAEDVLRRWFEGNGLLR